MGRVAGIAGGFPRSRERGPIEASLDSHATPNKRRFPRSRERGPIEALPRRLRLRRNSHFRAHVSAAPLKQKLSPPPDIAELNFRAHVSAAPLKRTAAVIDRRYRTISALT